MCVLKCVCVCVGLLFDGDSPLRVELQLQSSVSALNRAHDFNNMLSATCVCDVHTHTSIKCCVYLRLHIHTLVHMHHCDEIETGVSVLGGDLVVNLWNSCTGSTEPCSSSSGTGSAAGAINSLAATGAIITGWALSGFWLIINIHYSVHFIVQTGCHRESHWWL